MAVEPLVERRAERSAGRRARRRTGWAVGAGAAGVVLLAVLGMAALAGGDPAGTPSGTVPASGQTWSAQEEAERFLDRWVDEDGRVVRRDQGEDTVSEGQAYGLLIAVGADDEARFDLIWQWTKTHLMRDDGLLSWHWQDGQVRDAGPAADAELDAARALVLAGESFGRPDLTADGNALASGVLDAMTARTSLGLVLLPGLWAADGSDYTYNPSYASPVSFSVLARSTGDGRWAEIMAGSANATNALLDQSALPPDWSLIQAGQGIGAIAGAEGAGAAAHYSYDAARLPIRYAESCRAEDRQIAARLHAPLGAQVQIPVTLDLDGSGSAGDQHPLAYLARAAAAAADGEPGSAARDIDRAYRLRQDYDTYYGAAWTALTRLMLETDTLGGCPTLEEGVRGPDVSGNE